MREFITAAEAARRYRVTKEVIYRLFDSGKISQRVAGKKSYREFPVDELEPILNPPVPGATQSEPVAPYFPPPGPILTPFNPQDRGGELSSPETAAVFIAKHIPATQQLALCKMEMAHAVHLGYRDIHPPHMGPALVAAGFHKVEDGKRFKMVKGSALHLYAREPAKYKDMSRAEARRRLLAQYPRLDEVIRGGPWAANNGATPFHPPVPVNALPPDVLAGMVLVVEVFGDLLRKYKK